MKARGGTEVGVSYWRSVGVASKFEKRLHAAGIRTQRQFVTLTREQFLALPGLGSGALYACEKALGVRLVSPVSLWIYLGIPKRVAIRLAELGIATVDDLAKAEAEYLLRNGVSLEDAVLLKRVASRLGGSAALGKALSAISGAGRWFGA